MRSFRIVGLAPQPFAHLVGLPENELEAYGARRRVADATPGFPDRIELRDAEPGQTLLLINYVHQPADTPYRASHAIYLREGARVRFDRIDEVPPALRGRMLSLRSFDASGTMLDADLVAGRDAERLIGRLLDDERAAYVHAHFAARGCYAARIERATAQP